jgi:hypothetical protein
MGHVPMGHVQWDTSNGTRPMGHVPSELTNRNVAGGPSPRRARQQCAQPRVHHAPMLRTVARDRDHTPMRPISPRAQASGDSTSTSLTHGKSRLGCHRCATCADLTAARRAHDSLTAPHVARRPCKRHVPAFHTGASLLLCMGHARTLARSPHQFGMTVRRVPGRLSHRRRT